jgi:hypothetical protein
MRRRPPMTCLQHSDGSDRVSRPPLPPDVHEALVEMWTGLLLAALQATPSPVAVWTYPAPDLDAWLQACCLPDDENAA